MDEFLAPDVVACHKISDWYTDYSCRHGSKYTTIETVQQCRIIIGFGKKSPEVFKSKSLGPGGEKAADNQS